MCPLNVSQHPFMARCFPRMTTRQVSSNVIICFVTYHDSCSRFHIFWRPGGKKKGKKGSHRNEKLKTKLLISSFNETTAKPATRRLFCRCCGW
jgi:hypothetical protein